MSAAALPPLIAHVVYRFDIGGLENGVANLINNMPPQAYRHVVISLTEITDFKDRIRRKDVEFISLHKPPGHAVRLYPRLFRLFRRLRPDIVHTRNLAALEATVPAWAAGVPVRIHGEHGLEGIDLNGGWRKYDVLRRVYRPFVTSYVGLSRQLVAYLLGPIRVSRDRVAQIYNGVDAERFRAATEVPPALPDCPFSPGEHWLVGTVGRMQPVKNQALLARAFVRALVLAPELGTRMRLVLVGDGPRRPEIESILKEGGVAGQCWLAGERNDVAAILSGLDCFVLPSQSEGISNVILEAMASGLPVIATNVGGNGELVEDGGTGLLVPVGDVDAMAHAILKLAGNAATAREMGSRGRQAVENRFSLQAMVRNYQNLYDNHLARGAGKPAQRRSADRPT